MNFQHIIVVVLNDAAQSPVNDKRICLHSEGKSESVAEIFIIYSTNANDK